MLSHGRRTLGKSAEEFESGLPCAGKVENLSQKCPVPNRRRRRTEHVDDKYHGTRFLIQAGTLTEMKVEMGTRIELYSPSGFSEQRSRPWRMITRPPGLAPHSLHMSACAPKLSTQSLDTDIINLLHRAKSPLMMDSHSTREPNRNL